MNLYCGEDVIQQNPENIDAERWLDEGELTELPEIPRQEVEIELPTVLAGEVTEVERLEVPIYPYLEMPMSTENPEVKATRAGIHERIQVKMYHEVKEA